MKDFLYNAVFYFNIFVLLYVLFVNGSYLFLSILSISNLRIHIRRIAYGEYEEMQGWVKTPPVSVIVPAFNEESTIRANVLSLLGLNYPEYEVIVVDDGSKDSTLQVLIDEFLLVKVQAVYRRQIETQEVIQMFRSIRYPNLTVIQKKNGGKADALNVGINVSNYPYFCAIDADSLLEKDALLKCMRPMLEGEDDVIACGGIVRIANGCVIRNGRVVDVRLPQSRVALYQVVEYLRGFLVGRLAFSSINNLLIISGAFGVFRKKEVMEVGGYNVNTVGEDMELVVRLQRYIYEKGLKSKALFVPDPVCWTEAPETLQILRRQRSRWHRGLMETMWIHKGVFFRPKYGVLGSFSMPFFLIVELLGPTIEFLGYIFLFIGYYLGVINLPYIFLFTIVSVLFGIFLSLSAILLEEWTLRRYPRIGDLLTLCWYSILENFWYRQLNAMWRTWAFVEQLRRKRDWGVMVRKGFDKPMDKGA